MRPVNSFIPIISNTDRLSIWKLSLVWENIKFPGRLCCNKRRLVDHWEPNHADQDVCVMGYGIHSPWCYWLLLLLCSQQPRDCRSSSPRHRRFASRTCSSHWKHWIDSTVSSLPFWRKEIHPSQYDITVIVW